MRELITPQSSMFAFRKSRWFEKAYTWILNHPTRFRWIALELFFRRLPLRQRLSNARWQWKHYGDSDAFDALWQTWNRSRDELEASRRA